MIGNFPPSSKSQGKDYLCQGPSFEGEEKDPKERSAHVYIPNESRS